MREIELAKAWKFVSGAFRGTEGEEIKVIHPGKENEDEGPDFKGAILKVNGKKVRGDVEIHTKASYWMAHGHNKDPRFSNVVLHVVMEANANAYTTNGRKLTTLVIKPEIRKCKVSVDVIEKLSLERLKRKSRRFAGSNFERTVFIGIASTLGYPRNKENFRRLVKNAGLEKARNSKEAEELLKEASSKIKWKRLKVRPTNLPEKRIKSLAKVWTRRKRILTSFLKLEFEKPLMECGIGKSRTKEIVVNVVLPALLAYAKKEKDRYVKEKVIKIYREYPPCPDNKILLLMKELTDLEFKNSFHQQGAIELYKRFCSKRRCKKCPV